MNIQLKGPPLSRMLLLLPLVAFFLSTLPGSATAAYINSIDKYSWSENSGWINFRPPHGGVTVNADHLTGYSWHENSGWLKLGSDTGGPYLNISPTNWGVNRDNAGNLSGYAWSEGRGWVNFKPTGGGVTVEPITGVFDGYAWGENIGWIHFKSLPGALVSYQVAATASSVGNMSAASKYAWSETVGWTNFRPTDGGVTIRADHLSGYAWHENIGWLKLGSDGGGPYLNTMATNWGVNRDAAGNLTGYAWSEGRGWINFNPTGGGVSVEPVTGTFSGYAWGENFGWMGFRSQPAAQFPYGVGIASYTLSLVFGGSGAGAVTGSSPPFSCNTNCKQTFLDNTSLRLTAAASRYSLLGGWQGCDTASGADCTLTLTSDRTTTVTFTKDTVHVARIDGAIPVYYPTLQSAYDKALTGNIIQVWGIELPESLLCGNGTALRIMGGYDQQYLNRTGITTLRGVTIKNGTVTVDRIVIR